MTATRLATATLLAVVALTLDITQLTAQSITESDCPREADLVLADEPLVRVGLLDGPDEYLFGNITGAVRLEDGSVVVADQSNFEIRMFDARGRHVWSSGRRGEGPGEYEGLRLMRGCLSERFPAYVSEGLLSLPDGSVWVVPDPWRDLKGRAEFHLLGPDGTWLHRLMIPSGRTLLDAGPGWVLLLEKGELDEQSVAVYELVEGS